MEKVIVITVDGLSQEKLDMVQKQLDLRLDELYRQTQKRTWYIKHSSACICTKRDSEGTYVATFVVESHV